MIRQLAIPTGDEARFSFFLVLAFTAGFSERAVKEVLRTAEGSLADGGGGGGAPDRPGRAEPVRVQLIPRERPPTA